MNITTRSHPVALELCNIHKDYGFLEVLKGLNIRVHSGEVYGFLGRNGAGKSTAIRIMLGITRADRGDVILFGDQTGSSIKARQRIGYVAQEQNFYRWMTPKSIGRFVRGFYPRWSDTRYQDLCRRFSLPYQRKIGTFSGGMKAKLALSMAIACSPELLILDEPTAGMDPIARREFLDLVREQAIQEGATVLFSTHLIDDIESVADRICIVDDGVSHYEGALGPLASSVRLFVADAGVKLPLPFDDNQGSRYQIIRRSLIQNDRHEDRQAVVLRASDYQSAFSRQQLAFLRSYGWVEQTMSLEDVFISTVTASESSV